MVGVWRGRLRSLLVVLTVLVTLGSLSSATQQASAADTVSVPLGGTWTVNGHGFGHGHGMSQYGARGAARSGLNATQITDFYYPNTSLYTADPIGIRVRISDDNADVLVGWREGLTLSWSGGSVALPSVAGGRWRLVPSGAGLAAQYFSGTAWQPWLDSLPASADFSAGGAVIRLYLAGSISVDYRGTLGAVRSGAGLMTVNRLSLEDYLRGVVPREMPASWEAEAVKAQAIAARSYARYKIEHAGTAAFDICDTTTCQVYGGYQRYDGNTAVYGESATSNAAIDATAHQIRIYNGQTIFAEYSSSNGGWTANGGQPYLIARQDPYEQGSSSPYYAWTRTVSAAAVASYYGLSQLKTIRITQRDGNGDWGGRVVTAFVDGVRNGSSASIQTTGATLATAMGLPHQWFMFLVTPSIGVLDSFVQTGMHGFRLQGWVIDPDHSDASPLVDVYIDNLGPFTFASGLSRPDVQAAYGTATAALGFSLDIRVASGTHQVCVYSKDFEGAADGPLGCRTLNIPSEPIGVLDSLAQAPGALTLRGWAFDPDLDGEPGQVHIYVDSAGYGFTTGVERGDVRAVYGLAGASVGFSASVPITAGQHRLCLYAINLRGAGSNNAFDCRMVTFSVDPVGVVDRMTRMGDGTYQIAGWAYDPELSGGPGHIHVYVDNALYAFDAVGSRRDVQQAYGLQNDAVGFVASVAVPPGQHRICVYAINLAGAGVNPGIGCQTVQG